MTLGRSLLQAFKHGRETLLQLAWRMQSSLRWTAIIWIPAPNGLAARQLRASRRCGRSAFFIIRCIATHASTARTPTYGSGLEPIFAENGVSIVFSGHDHVYERFRPQKGNSLLGGG